jgi:hypothetical protein
MNNILLLLLVFLLIFWIFENSNAKQETFLQPQPQSPEIKILIPKIIYNEPSKIKEFNKNFFDFRDLTCNNSSMKIDSVDRTLVLENMKGLKIKDVFDDLTKN